MQARAQQVQLAAPERGARGALTEGDREAGFKSLLRELTLGDSARRARQEEPQ